MKQFVLLQKLVPGIRRRFHAFVRDHIIDDDPWDPETVLGALSASIGRPLPTPATGPARSKTGAAPALDPEKRTAIEPVA